MAENQPIIDLSPLEERPLVTFALFAYNQEKYIREAVRGALAQTYEPLEIILSDDCSTDRTYEIMKEVTEHYKGPHRIILNRTTSNKGIFPHVMDVVNQARGELLIMAAGDDVSTTNRTLELYTTWRATNAWGLYSHHDVIDEYGKKIASGRRPKKGDGHSTLSSYFIESEKIQLVHGATSAYDKKLFSLLLFENPPPIHSEDGIFSFMLNLLNKKIICHPSSLVNYRTHPKSISHTSQQKVSFESIIKQEQNATQLARNLLEFNNAIKIISKNLQCKKSRTLNLNAIKNADRFFGMRANWLSITVTERFLLLVKCRAVEEFKFMITRLFGVHVFATIKLFYSTIFRKNII